VQLVLKLKHFTWPPLLESDWLFHGIEGHLKEKVGHLEQEMGHLFTFFNVPGNDAYRTKKTYFTWSHPYFLIGYSSHSAEIRLHLQLH
jgi:hypothetical protein